MVLDEPGKNDETLTLQGYTFVADKEMLTKIGHVHVDAGKKRGLFVSSKFFAEGR